MKYTHLKSNNNLLIVYIARHIRCAFKRSFLLSMWKYRPRNVRKGKGKWNSPSKNNSIQLPYKYNDCYIAIKMQRELLSRCHCLLSIFEIESKHPQTMKIIKNTLKKCKCQTREGETKFHVKIVIAAFPFSHRSVLRRELSLSRMIIPFKMRICIRTETHIRNGYIVESCYTLIATSPFFFHLFFLYK